MSYKTLLFMLIFSVIFLTQCNIIGSDDNKNINKEIGIALQIFQYTQDMEDKVEVGNSVVEEPEQIYLSNMASKSIYVLSDLQVKILRADSTNSSPVFILLKDKNTDFIDASAVTSEYNWVSIAFSGTLYAFFVEGYNANIPSPLLISINADGFVIDTLRVYPEINTIGLPFFTIQKKDLKLSYESESLGLQFKNNTDLPMGAIGIQQKTDGILYYFNVSRDMIWEYEYGWPIPENYDISVFNIDF